MEISLLKNNGLIIKGKNSTLALDPLKGEKELDLEESKPQTVLISKFLFKGEQKSTGEEAKIFSWPGEFEVKGTAIMSKLQYPDEAPEERKLLFIIHIDGFKICYLPALNKELHSDLIELIGDVDLLIAPMVNDQKVISNSFEEIEPKAVIALNKSDDPSLGEQFAKILGLASLEEKTVLKITHKSDLPSDKMQIFTLKVS